MLNLEALLATLPIMLYGLAGIFIVIGVIALCVKLLIYCFPSKQDEPEAGPGSELIQSAPAVPVEQSGESAGQFPLEGGAQDEETMAVLLAVVSEDAGIPLDELKILSVKAIS